MERTGRNRKQRGWSGTSPSTLLSPIYWTGKTIQSHKADFVLDERGKLCYPKDGPYLRGSYLRRRGAAEDWHETGAAPLQRILKGVIFLEKGIVHTSIDRLVGYMIELPAAERQGIARALTCIDGMPEQEKEKALLALQRAVYPRIRAHKCHKNDVKSRTLVGTRVSREFAELCREAARRRGQSLNEWCRAAIWNALLLQDRQSTISCGNGKA